MGAELIRGIKSPNAILDDVFVTITCYDLYLEQLKLLYDDSNTALVRELEKPAKERNEDVFIKFAHFDSLYHYTLERRQKYSQ